MGTLAQVWKVFKTQKEQYGGYPLWTLITKIGKLGLAPKSGRGYANLKIAIYMKKSLSDGIKKIFCYSRCSTNIKKFWRIYGSPTDMYISWLCSSF